MFETLSNRLFDILISGAVGVFITAAVLTRNDVVQTVIAAETRDVEAEFAVRCAPDLAGHIRCRLTGDHAVIQTANDLAEADTRSASLNQAPGRKFHD